MFREESAYSKKLRDPRWQRMRLKILERDKWACLRCGDSKETLHVHHRYYVRGKEPWDYPPESLETLCEICHWGEFELRPDFEQKLLYALKFQGWWAGSVGNLANAILNMKEYTDARQVVFNAICMTLQDPVLQKKCVDAYLEQLADNPDGLAPQD